MMEKKAIHSKQMNSTNGGTMQRVGYKFLAAIEEIKDKRLLNGNSKERVSTEKISNMIVRHKSWKEISKHIINASGEEIEEYGI